MVSEDIPSDLSVRKEEAVPIGAGTYLDGKFFVWLRQKLLKSVRIPASFFLARQKFFSPICIPSPIGTASYFRTERSEGIFAMFCGCRCLQRRAKRLASNVLFPSFKLGNNTIGTASTPTASAYRRPRGGGFFAPRQFHYRLTARRIRGVSSSAIPPPASAVTSWG